MRIFNKYGFITVYGVLFILVLYKVLNVPVTHDEVPTALFYSRFSFWEIMMYPDNIPNNHILNSLLTKICITLFGTEQWSIRLPNLLGFVIYGLAVFRILNHSLKLNPVFFLPAAILFVNPYLLDFFGLCRGYGLSVAIMTLSLSYLLSGYLFSNRTHIWVSLIIAIIASYANFTLLLYWAANIILVVFYFLKVSGFKFSKFIIPLMVILTISIAYIALIITPLQKMHSTDEFQYWTSQGFYKETFISLVHNWKYDSPTLQKINSTAIVVFVSLIIVVNCLCSVCIIIRKKFNLKQINHPVIISVAILLITVLANIIQTYCLGTPNLNGRTALFFYPLFSANLAGFISLIPEKTRFINRAAALTLTVLCIVNLADRFSLKSVKEWYYDQNNLEVAEFLKTKYDANPVSLKTSWFFNPSLFFYSETGKIPWIKLYPYDSNIDITTNAEYYYVFADDYKILEPRFEVVHKFSPDRWLLQQKPF
ncbi:MAG: hypothetical protein PHH93_10625 [Prolixibacteraceae bacterium]|nr:hypothetical protein [Prolixibacteraceae bacterium]